MEGDFRIDRRRIQPQLNAIVSPDNRWAGFYAEGKLTKVPVDGRWIAFSCDESNRDEVYVRPFPGPSIKHQVSSEEAIQPPRARNDKQFLYRWQDQVWIVDVQTDGGFATGKPHLLYEHPCYARGDPIRCYDLSNDGQRFLMVKREQLAPRPVTEMILVQI